ncbi:MAG TPA: sel1 repeat family protein, partial [Azonexus sp.]|nr:sel1 repeat family protein [Azonexus sp.]
AAERGDRKAQTAVGKLYLMGLEEMGSDPAEAEKWLSIAAGRGDKEAKKLLSQASAAKKNEVAYRRWVDSQRVYWNDYWQSRYTYRWYWGNGGWYYRDDY